MQRFVTALSIEAQLTYESAKGLAALTRGSTKEERCGTSEEDDGNLTHTSGASSRVDQ